MDSRYIRELKDNSAALEKQKEDAIELGNDEKVAELQNQIEVIEKKCLTHVRSDGKSYQFNDREQKSKNDSISKGIKRCIEKIKEDSLKAGCNELLIWNHLNESIKFEGSLIFYMPKETTTWN